MGAIYIMWLREVKRYFRSKAQIIVSLGQPTLYLLALGFGFGPVFAKAGAGNYLQFMAPGVIGAGGNAISGGPYGPSASSSCAAPDYRLCLRPRRKRTSMLSSIGLRDCPGAPH